MAPLRWEPWSNNVERLYLGACVVAAVHGNLYTLYLDKEGLPTVWSRAYRGMTVKQAAENGVRAWLEAAGLPAPPASEGER